MMFILLLIWLSRKFWCWAFERDWTVNSFREKRTCIDWSRRVESLRSSRVFDLSRLDSSQNSWLEYSSQRIEIEYWSEILDSTRQAIEYDVKRAKYRKFFRFYAFALSFCITFLIESHEEKHEDYLIESHNEKTWRLFDRKSWRKVMKKSHEEKSWRENMKTIW